MTKFTKFKDGFTYKADPLTGELKEAEINIKVNNDNWIAFFLQNIEPFIQLTGNQMRLMTIIWKISSYNPNGCKEGNLFTNSPLFKQQVREHGLNWSDLQINNEVSRLARTGLIIKVIRGSYMLNPDYFFKGTLADRTKLKMTLANQEFIEALQNTQSQR